MLGIQGLHGLFAIAHRQNFNTAGLKCVKQRRTMLPSHDEHGRDFRLHTNGWDDDEANVVSQISIDPAPAENDVEKYEGTLTELVG